MKVLHVLPTLDPAYGGPVKSVEALTAICRARGIEVTVYPEGYVKRRTYLLPYYPGLKGLRRLYNLVRKADLIHIHGLWNTVTTLAALFARSTVRPYVMVPHGMLDRWALRRSRFKKFVYSVLIERRNLCKASAIHLLNEGELLEAEYYGLKAPTFILPNAVDPCEFDLLPGKEVLYSIYPKLRDKTVLLYLGRIHPKKGFNLLIPAFARAFRQLGNLCLIVAGPDEGGYQRFVERMVSQHNLCDSVEFTGLVTGESKKVLLGGADYLILPSYQEGDSVAVKEAMASSLPVIVTKACHLPEVTAYGAGVEVEGKVDEIADAIVLLGDSPDMRRAMGKNARKLVEDKFSYEKIGDKLIEIYESIIKNG